MNVNILLGKTPYKVRLSFAKYRNNNNTAIEGFCLAEEGDYEEPFATFSVNTPTKLPKNHVGIKNYSENSGFMEQLIAQKVISEPVFLVDTGFVQVPICEILIPFEYEV